MLRSGAALEVEGGFLAGSRGVPRSAYWPISVSQNLRNLWRYLRRARFVLLPNPYGATGILRARFNDAVFFSYRHWYLFAGNEKVANSTLRATFQSLEAKCRLPPHYQRFKRWTGPLLQPSDVTDFAQFLSDKTFKKFCVVRHPYARLVSCYRNKFENSGPERRGYRRAMRDLGLDPRHHPPLSFAEFIKTVAKQPHTRMNAHWRIQYFNTFMDLIPYDEIIRLEDFGERLPKLIAELYPEWAGDPERAVLSYKNNPKKSEELVNQYFNEELRAIARKTYQLDFQILGYEA